MKIYPKLALQALIFATTGGVIGYFFGHRLPAATIIELIHALGNIGAIAGSMLGWSVGWLGQSRSLIKEIDYDSARDLFQQLGQLQKELIIRWGITLTASIVAIVCAVILKTASLNPEVFKLIITFSIALIFITIGFMLYLFQRMLVLAALKSKLDSHERDQLRKRRNLSK